MAQLPTTFVEAIEAEALAFARDWIEWHRRDPNGLFHPNATTVYGKSLMKAYAQSHPFGADDIVYFAENGSKEAHLALVDLIAEYADRGEQSAVLTAYNIRLMKRLANPESEPRRSGPAMADNFLRDTGIMLLVIDLMDRFNLRPTRNRESRKPSASSIAADALTKAGIGISMGYKGVEKVWGRYLPALAGTRYALRTRFAAGFPTDYSGLFGKMSY
jgi:hypothetical protein